MTRLVRILALALLGSLLMVVTPVLAADATVGDGTPESCTEAALDDAVDTLNSSNGGTITFNCGGVVTIPVTTQKAFSGTNAAYVIDGGNNVTLDGQDDTRVLYTASGQGLTFTLRNITITNGNAKDDANGERANNQGGGLYSGYENTLIIYNVTFTNNTALAERHEYHGGGAIAIDTTSIVTITNSTFIGNTAPNGGAINNLLSDLTIENSVFRQNEATRPDPGGGGAVYNDAGKLTIKDTLIIDNTSANLGGGIFSWAHNVMEYSGKTKLVNTVLAENHAEHGGGMWKGGAYVASLKNVTVANNTADERGAGISGTGPGPNFKITNSTISGNEVLGDGSAGGVFSSGNSSTIKNSTIVYNTIPGGSDSISVGAAIHGDVTLKNTIVAHNLGGWNGTWSCQGNIVNGGYNIQFPTNTCGGSIPIKDPLIDESLFPAIADVTPGGVTPTHALSLESNAAVNKADNCPKTDQRNVARPQGDYCDIGAYELEGTPPGTFSLIAPANNATVTDFTFSWTISDGAATYKFTVKDGSGNKVVSEKLTPAQANCDTECSYSPSTNFQSGASYEWQVKSKNVFGKFKSESRNFTAQGGREFETTTSELQGFGSR